MAATTSNTTPRRNGFDFAALAASAGPKGSADEVARLRAAVETLSELVVAHGVMDARTLASLLGDLAQPSQPVALGAPLPPPAPSAAEARLKPIAHKAAPVAAKRPAPAPFVAPAPPVAPAPVALAPVALAPAPAVAPAPVAPAPVAPAPASVAAPTLVAPAPEPTAAPLVATPAPAAAAAPPVDKTTKKNPFAPVPVDAARLAAELGDVPPPALTSQGFFSRLFGRKKTSPAAVAAAAESIEFTERTPKLPADTLYAEQQRATELSFPPPSTVVRKPRAAAPRKKGAPRAADAAPARFCDRCWRRMDASGTCKTCPPSA